MYRHGHLFSSYLHTFHRRGSCVTQNKAGTLKQCLLKVSSDQPQRILTLTQRMSLTVSSDKALKVSLTFLAKKAN